MIVALVALVLVVAPAQPMKTARPHHYNKAIASWYGPGLYGNKLACGGRLTTGTIGVAHKTMPCGHKLRLAFHGRRLNVRVIDRGPYVAGRDFDLTAATKHRLHFLNGYGPILWRHR